MVDGETQTLPLSDVIYNEYMHNLSILNNDNVKNMISQNLNLSVDENENYTKLGQ